MSHDEIEQSDDEIEEGYCPQCKGWGFTYGGANQGTGWTLDCGTCQGQDQRGWQDFKQKYLSQWRTK